MFRYSIEIEVFPLENTQIVARTEMIVFTRNTNVLPTLSLSRGGRDHLEIVVTAGTTRGETGRKEEEEQEEKERPSVNRRIHFRSK